MATRLSDTKTPHPCDTIAQQIEDMTSKVIKLILSRKKCLLVELADHRSRYDNLVANKSETEKELLNLRQHTEDITRNELKGIQDKLLSEIEDKLNKLTSSVTSFKLDIVIDTQGIERQIKQLGKIVKTKFKIPKYSVMETPVVAVGKKGSNKKHKLNEPRGVAFEDESGLIFVCDSCNSCVKVFSSEFRDPCDPSHASTESTRLCVVIFNMHCV